MKDIKNHTVIWLKGGLFLTLGLTSAILLLAEFATLKAAFLVALTVWGFCRAYYFAFYVIEHYVDPGYRFSGLFSFACYALRRKVHDLVAPSVLILGIRVLPQRNGLTPFSPHLRSQPRASHLKVRC